MRKRLSTTGYYGANLTICVIVLNFLRNDVHDTIIITHAAPAHTIWPYTGLRRVVRG
ncbi:hypothetical protein [Spirosoma validum]|uniref:Uncharacterized protein n=1 Tax=Spirosoma validum TaxID=2771355 RepID=A0A927B151_9BACT|nr:hypothetical protein [Spirosoma validum]MBD2753651.1 hypothetical protein [Spirosoma validum]